ncbi:MAG: DUF29 domain-containing protein [Alphaproteobacteria bacterium]|nr:DUF29 domain-containing protein [Alphaproteobacteria bacterium]
MALYDEDYFAWTRQQAAELRKLAAARANLPLDLALLAEEVEDLGSETYNACASQIGRILKHLLKLEHSPASRPRGSWMSSVVEARGEIERRRTRTIDAKLRDELDRIYRRARQQAELELAEHDESPSLPAACPYDWDQIIDDGWWPEARASS